ncbi:MAG: hypothetical protein HY960_12815 [Ignavibacteriae bacterium]|nr:hypothetical protein [Ignavibacteriota bacterium]
MKYSPILICSVFVLLIGCTHFQETLTNTEQVYPVTNKDAIEIFLTIESPTRAFTEVGFVTVEHQENVQAAVTFLKEKAAKQGADAIINFEVHVYRRLAALILFIPIYENTYIASGVAVKYSLNTSSIGKTL